MDDAFHQRLRVALQDKLPDGGSTTDCLNRLSVSSTVRAKTGAASSEPSMSLEDARGKLCKCLLCPGHRDALPAAGHTPQRQPVLPVLSIILSMRDIAISNREARSAMDIDIYRYLYELTTHALSAALRTPTSWPITAAWATSGRSVCPGSLAIPSSQTCVSGKPRLDAGLPHRAQKPL